MLVILGILCAASSGCANITLPRGELGEYGRRTSIFGIVNEVRVTNITKNTDGTSVGDAEITLSFPGVEHRQTLKGLRIIPETP